MSEQTMDVVVAAHLCLDIFPVLGSLAAGALETHGRLFQIGPLHATTGGLAANTGVALHQLGAGVRLLAAVGDDLVGEFTLDALRRVSPDLSRHVRVREQTASSYTVVLARPGEDRLFLHYPGPNAGFTMDDLDFGLLNGARWFHFGYPPLLPHTIAADGRMLHDIMRRAKDAGTVTSLDFTLPDPTTASGQVDWPRILRRVLPEVDVFVPSVEEAVYLLRRSLYFEWEGRVAEHITRDLLDQMAAELLAMEPAIVGFKLGDQGAVMYGADAARLERLSGQITGVGRWANRTIQQPAFAVNVSGTTGAGDAAYGGLIMALLEGFDPDAAVRQFCACGAAAVEAPDGVRGLLSAPELRSRFTSNFPALPSRLVRTV
ncbi:MAG: carbohydrate kinase family protein [Anaerolineae bacterium]|nr:carbohydrate kinase family protein [Anaerolineae bacterium]